MKMHIVLAGFAALAIAPPAGAQTADVTSLVAACAACHGTQGQGSGSIPALRGLSQVQIAEQLRAFKAGTRPATVMNRFAKAYSDDEIAALAAYFSRLK